jgi:hypothetical protein
MKLGASYFGNRWLKHAERDLKDIKARHCDWVLHTYDEADLLYNQGNMKAITALSHRLGLQVYFSPWALGGVFGGESVSSFTARHPEACQMLSTGERTPHACPAHPEFRAFMRTWIEAACAAGGDVLFWDEPHLWLAAWEGRPDLPEVYSVGSAYAQEQWKRRRKKALPKVRTPEVDAYREWLLYDFLKWATRTARAVRPGIKNAVCMPSHPGAWPNPLWEKMAALASVDIFSTDPYWKGVPTGNPVKTPLAGFVDLHARRLVEIGKRHKKETLIWLQLFALRQEDHADIDTALAMFEHAGVKNIGAWGYGGAGAFSSIASRDSDVLWRRLGRHYARLKGKRA